ncbi:hypothetical protein HDF26_000540 [Pedobacter cryoconitis]|uniref:hypothetical protein n=1 Tax=Pedobacter cryoconitis TaxID=188932 RepID=UPI001622270E|nr:hypothetical protein [Pedobacter cryoconitis]MBB6270113.1 hypothetical protein [Pedobacter cryoconitis]
MKTLSMFSLLIISAFLANAKPVEIKDPPKERKNEVLTAPMKLSKAAYIYVARPIQTEIGPSGISCPFSIVKNETTGETVTASYSGSAILNISAGDVVTALFDFSGQSSKKFTGAVTISVSEFNSGYKTIWVR